MSKSARFAPFVWSTAHVAAKVQISLEFLQIKFCVYGVNHE